MKVYFSPTQEKLMIESGKPSQGMWFPWLHPRTNRQFGKFLTKHPEHAAEALKQGILLFSRNGRSWDVKTRAAVEDQLKHAENLIKKETKI